MYRLFQKCRSQSRKLYAKVVETVKFCSFLFSMTSYNYIVLKQKINLKGFHKLFCKNPKNNASLQKLSKYIFLELS